MHNALGAKEGGMKINCMYRTGRHLNRHAGAFDDRTSLFMRANLLTIYLDATLHPYKKAGSGSN
jgi:hypothetical protein